MNSTISQTLEQFITQESLEGAHVLVMVSGGVDSIVLLDLLVSTTMIEKIHVFHLNHKTRPESDSDALFVQRLCEQYNIPCYTEALQQQTTKNKEASWRNERHTRAQALAKKHHLARVLTAHHATDLAETMIHRITKGCGLDGLSPFNTATKPLWKVSKKDIIAYAKEKKLEWVIDNSNEDQTFERNLIRTSVLPHLRTITQNLEKVFVKEATLFSEAQKYIDQQVQNIVQDKTTLPLVDFQSLHPFLQKELLRSIVQKTPSYDEIQDCLKWLLGSPQGNTQKVLGGTLLSVVKNNIHWR